MGALHAKAGDQIVVIGSAAMAGASRLAHSFYERLHERYATDFLAPIMQFEDNNNSQYIKETMAELSWSCYIEAGYAGVYGALFQLGYESDLGFRVDLKSIPIFQPTIEVAEFFDLNPYLLYSAGVMVVATSNGLALVDQLQKKGIAATVVGYMTKEKARIVYLEDEDRYLTPSKDELVKIFPENEIKKQYPKKLVFVNYDEDI